MNKYDHEYIKALRAEGLHPNKIAKIVGCSAATVYLVTKGMQTLDDDIMEIEDLKSVISMTRARLRENINKLKNNMRVIERNLPETVSEQWRGYRNMMHAYAHYQKHQRVRRGARR